MKQQRLVFLLALVVSSARVASLYSQPPATGIPDTSLVTSNIDPTSEDIRKQISAFVGAFNQRDAKALAGFWTLDGEYVDESGQGFQGRDAIEAYFSDVFATRPNAKLQLVTDSLRLLSDSTAMEDGQSIVEASPGAEAVVNNYLAIHVKKDGKWLLASVRDKLVANEPSPSGVLADLNWLIGDWIAEENGVRTESTCRWIADKKFVERSYSTIQLDGSMTTGVQIIGWNSQTHQVQSWNFSPDGGHAVGVWTPTDGGWLAKITGTTGSNESTTAVNLLRRLDDDAYAWQSIDRTVGDVRLADTAEVIIRRKRSSK